MITPLYGEILRTREKEAKDTKTKDFRLQRMYSMDWFSKGYSLIDSARYDEAVEAFDKAIGQNPDSKETYTGRAMAYSYLFKHEQAIEDYSKVIELDPSDGEAYRNRGASYDRLFRHEQAISDYEKSIEINPEDFVAYVRRGFSFLYLGDKEKAAEDLKIAAKMGHQPAQDYLKSEGIEW